MATKRVPYPVQRASSDIGKQLALWRRMQNLTAQQVAERADISRDTLRRLEHGDPGVTMASLLGVLRALGALDRAVDALDPMQTDIGRIRAIESIPKRVRH
ncbi:helix-turn-helix domain-containing protein [Gordonia amarae]|uniref:HTH cro/C1-type domain-containing protein n=2 Tax=Gordonia amarae TaxID=36821 RepID=G7GTL4_9ACTN|nr:helix-turn-helix transcriptional regulator [Gordonia amarae]MCS3877832.1 transcriptional regulator with XRE-family HTH domain [Gordonia amarae]QHN16518.1 helix-turn-helix domain-containing protein [Gordonia amarae]QHN21087.1 helix-turn-helix domain-containing protein [Gordonia amarae]QHN29938.1 helix-turn-helix domain-containing protein [Gordonia amarae]QHN38714.1 helix-turn-helix domain-containing protein [Gordonia amarae]